MTTAAAHARIPAERYSARSYGCVVLVVFTICSGFGDAGGEPYVIVTSRAPSPSEAGGQIVTRRSRRLAIGVAIAFRLASGACG